MQSIQWNEKIFREYDIRGIADRDLTREHISLLGAALTTYFRAHHVSQVVIGRDCRMSSERIFGTLLDSFLSGGISVIDIGLVPTPVLYFAHWELNIEAAIMITGSHNPSDQNGLKICIKKKSVYGEAIQEIAKLAIQGSSFQPPPSHIKNTSHQTKDILPLYFATLIHNLIHPLNLSIIVDSGNGMAGIIAPKLYRELGCEVEEMFSELNGSFPNHPPDPTQKENIEQLIYRCHREKKIGLAFDGDADRISVIDPSGRLLFGDELLMIYARDILQHNPNATIISEVKCSPRLFKDIKKHGGNPILWKTGHSLIKAKMHETNAILAGEMSGHMFFKDRYYGFDDAIYAGGRLLEIIARTQLKPMDLLSDLPPAFATEEIRVDCSDDLKFPLIEQAVVLFEKMGFNVNQVDGIRVEFEDGFGLVRGSNTQPVLVYRFEAETQARLKEIQKIFEEIILQAKEMILGSSPKNTRPTSQ